METAFQVNNHDRNLPTRMNRTPSKAPVPGWTNVCAWCTIDLPVENESHLRATMGSEVRLLGRDTVAGPAICHGKPTFRGTRVIVWHVLQMIADGIAWATMVEEWGRSVTKETVAEAVRLAGKSSAEDAFAYALELALA